MKRKVYVMDCGDFVKIGVSGNVEQRATQIPYKVSRIYSTNEMEDAFKLEHEMHVMFCKDRVPDALGREYFNIPFDVIPTPNSFTLNSSVYSILTTLSFEERLNNS